LLSLSRKTGACFLDGQYDVYFNQQFWMSEARNESCGWFHRRSVCERYLGLGFCGDSTRAPGMDADSIVMTDPSLAPKQSARLLKSVTAADFAISEFRLVECGSELPSAQACALHGPADLLPAPPIRALCNTLNEGGPAHHCELASLPEKSHTECSLAGVADKGVRAVRERRRLGARVSPSATAGQVGSSVMPSYTESTANESAGLVRCTISPPRASRSVQPSAVRSTTVMRRVRCATRRTAFSEGSCL
jgi:hypothetical protein